MSIPVSDADDHGGEPSGSGLAGQYRRYLAAVVLFHQYAAHALGIGATDYQACSILALEGPLTSGDLGSGLGLTSGATTRLIDRLVAAEYAHRTHDPTDRRRVLVAHTGLVEQRVDELLKDVRTSIGLAIGSLDAHQRAGLQTYLSSATRAFTQAARPSTDAGHEPGSSS